MDAKDYIVRCDKHAFSPYDYCEMCMIRTKLQNAIEISRKEMQRSCAEVNLCLNEIYDIFDKHQNQINKLKEIINGQSRAEQEGSHPE